MVAISYGLPIGKNWPQSLFKRAHFIGFQKAIKKCDTLPMIFEKIKQISVSKKNTPKLTKTTLKMSGQGSCNGGY